MHRTLTHRVTFVALWIAAIALTAAPVAAQNPTGTISGRVVDSGGLALAGATVTAQSSSLQGTRSTKSSENGDYILPLLPPGQYTLSFDYRGFAPLKRTADLAATETARVDATLQPAAVSEAVTVTASSDAFTNTIQGATNFKQDFIALLPTARTLLSAANLAPGVHGTGPDGNFSLAGAMSFESLFLLNGVTIQDNLRGEPLTLFIEDAIQETTVSTSGISAEYGRFTGGIVNAISRSGGNLFSGSFRTTLTNDNWRTKTPFDEPKVDVVVPTYEYTVGGPIVKDKTWFFAAARHFDQSQARQTGFTNLAYTAGLNEKRFEVKLTQALGAQHNVKGSYMTIRTEETNNAFPSPAGIMDLRSLSTRQLPQELLSLHYSGAIGSNLFLEGQYSSRQFTFENSGGKSTDLIQGTLLQDQQNGTLWWAPAFCGVCGPEERDNQNLLAKGTYFLSTGRGAHAMTFGYDTFNDRRKGNNHQSASDYHVWTTTSLVRGDAVYPVMANDGSTWIIWWPIRQESLGTNFRTHSLFFNDQWQLNRHVTVNLGLRFDKNHGEDAIGHLVADDSAWSPRLGVVFDPSGNGTWTVNASYGKYVAAIANSIADSSSPAGTPSILAYFYQGPPINVNPNAPLVSTEAALQTLFGWFNANGGTNRSPFFVSLPGVAVQIPESLRSPNANEFAVGLSRRLGSRGALRADVIVRRFGDFYAERIDTTTGRVTDEEGQEFDLTLVENTDAVSRQYTALNLQANYRLTPRITAGGNYTLSRLWGNVNGENINSGPLTSSVLSYPEYFDTSWSAPEGDLLADQRHRLRLWGTVGLPFFERLGRLSLGVLEQIESGTPYGALGQIRTGAFVTNPGYVTPPDTVNYYFTSRDHFRTEAMYRTDVSLNYAHGVAGARRAEVFAQFHLLNVFNQFQLINLVGATINTTVLTAVDDPARFTRFDPFTTTPVQGVHWDYGPEFGKATGAGAYTLPRTFRFSVGVRF